MSEERHKRQEAQRLLLWIRVYVFGFDVELSKGPSYSFDSLIIHSFIYSINQ